MDALNFAYWLNGFAELHGDTPPTEAQWKAIREHLELVFKKVTPPVGLPQWPKDWTPSTAPKEIPWWERQAQCASGTPVVAAAQSFC